MGKAKNGLKKIRSKWHSELNTVQRHNRTSLVSVYSYCQNEFLQRNDVPFKSLPAYGYYERVHKLLTLYEIPRGGVLFAEQGVITMAVM